MNSKVEFRDDTTGKVQMVTLVYPDQADISQGKVSVLTPVGTALIGLQTGDFITWEAPNGERRQLTVPLGPRTMCSLNPRESAPMFIGKSRV